MNNICIEKYKQKIKGDKMQRDVVAVAITDYLECVILW